PGAGRSDREVRARRPARAPLHRYPRKRRATRPPDRRSARWGRQLLNADPEGRALGEMGMSEDEILAPGKLPGELLSRLLRRYVRPHPSVLIGPEVGADAAAIEVSSSVIVVKSDPITFPTPNIGAYLVNVNANDIACMGAEPRWLLVTALLPEARFTAAMVEAQFHDLSAACDALGIALVGGHTEVTVGLDRPLMVGMMIGETDRESLLDLRRSRPGDAVLLVNGAAIEGTSILASEAHADDLRSIPGDVLARARDLIRDPGIS